MCDHTALRDDLVLQTTVGRDSTLASAPTLSRLETAATPAQAWALHGVLIDALRQAWPEVRIVVRGDSGFCRPRVLRRLDRWGVDYVLGLGRAPRARRRRPARAGPSGHSLDGMSIVRAPSIDAIEVSHRLHQFTRHSVCVGFGTL